MVLKKAARGCFGFWFMKDGFLEDQSHILARLVRTLEENASLLIHFQALSVRHLEKQVLN